jgi:sterol desaturase/sphingolipid hydroxylase (fatty acid hydroxylase superfamily)
MTARAFSARAADLATFPALMAGVIVATQALLGAPVPPILISGLVVGGLAVVAAILERVRPEREDYRRFDQPLRVEIAHFLLDYNLGYALAFAALVPIARAAAALFPVAPWPAAWPLPLQIALAALLAEAASYWQHRLSHRNAWLWRFHALHHSGGRLNLARTARFHFVDIGPGAFLVFLPLVLLRAPDVILTWAAALSGAVGVLQHSNIRVRTPAWLDRLICTPAVHRFHHSRAGRESNANFGTLVMVFDRLFGSYQLPDGPGPAAVGIEDDPVPRDDFMRQVLGPFRAPAGPQASPPR